MGLLNWDTSGSQLKKEMNQCSCALDLPNGAALRTQLLGKKDELATMLDTSSDKNHVIMFSNPLTFVFSNSPTKTTNIWIYVFFSTDCVYLRLATADDDATSELVDRAGTMVGPSQNMFFRQLQHVKEHVF